MICDKVETEGDKDMLLTTEAVAMMQFVRLWTVHNLLGPLSHLSLHSRLLCRTRNMSSLKIDSTNPLSYVTLCHHHQKVVILVTAIS